VAYRLAHLSDLHVLSLDGVGWKRFLNKRVSGLANIRGNRSHHHKPALVERLLRGLEEAKADHLVITGDLTNLALEAEFEAVRAMFDRHGLDARHVTVIPGNHDAYTRGAHRSKRFESYFAEYASSDASVAEAVAQDGAFPFLRRRGPLALFGLTTAVPRPLLVSSGVVGEDQRGKLAPLRAIAAEATPVLLAHHPIVNVASRVRRTLRGLGDADALVEDFASFDHAVALHGHLHARMWRKAKTARGAIEVLGATSASLEHHDEARMAGMNLYDFDDRGRLADAFALVVGGDGDKLVRREIPTIS
jgi:3',5'-cyclic AMP phosphodiesterase CpdA